MMFGGFAVVVSGVRMMLGGFIVVFSAFVFHGLPPDFFGWLRTCNALNILRFLLAAFDEPIRVNWL